MPRARRSFFVAADHLLDRRLIPSALIGPLYSGNADPLPEPEPDPGPNPGTSTPVVTPPMPPSGPIGPGTS